MSDPDQQHPDKFVHHVKRYLLVYYALLLGTAMTVLAFYLPFPSIAVNIGVALFIASCKAFLVAGYFMHLISERKVIYTVMAFTVFFFAGLMYLTVWSMQPENVPHIRHVP